jgi:endonuclease YncB( thermonuclease family)
MKVSHFTFLSLLLATTVVYADVIGHVVAVTDGYTIKVLDSDQVQHKVRLTGIDAPEREQPFGTASRDHLASMVAGKKVQVESSKLWQDP